MILSYKSVINTSLSKNEVLDAIEIETIPHKHSIFYNLQDYTFFMGKFEREAFSCIPLTTSVPPYGQLNSFVPKVAGEVIDETEKGSTLEIEISGTVFHFLFLIFFNMTCILYFFSGDGLAKWIFIMLGGNAAVLGYFVYISKKIIELFIKILRNAESRKNDK